MFTKSEICKKISSVLVLAGYITNFIIAPVYASAQTLEEQTLRRFETERGQISKGEVSKVNIPKALRLNVLTEQFFLWQNIPSSGKNPLSFDPAYRPAGWNDHAQVSLAFGDDQSTQFFGIPSNKDFVNPSGVQWLERIYGLSGWRFHLGECLDCSFLASNTETVTFSLDKGGKVSLTKLNATAAVLHTSGILALSFSDQSQEGGELIVAAPTVRNLMPLKRKKLHIFAQTHVNTGGYAVEHAEIQAKTTKNRAAIKASQDVIARGHSWENRGNITADYDINLKFEAKLDNQSHSIEAVDTLKIDAQDIDNEDGKLAGGSVFLTPKGALNNTRGKILAQRQVDFNKMGVLFSETGLIRSPEGLYLDDAAMVHLGEIQTTEDLGLREGHFTTSPKTTIEGCHCLLIERDAALADQPLTLAGTIRAESYYAFKNTVFGPNISIYRVTVSPGVQLSFGPNQVKHLTMYKRDRTFDNATLQSLESLEWLVSTEADFLREDFSMLGRLIVREAPNSTIPNWLITHNAYGRRGLELHLRNSEIVFGDSAGVTMPDWSADEGPVNITAKSFDQKSGVIAAKAGGCIQAHGKIKIGEAHEVKAESVTVGGFGFLTKGPTSANIGAGGVFSIHSSTSDIDFCFANLQLNRFRFTAAGDINFLSTEMKTRAGGLLRGQNLFLQPDDRYFNNCVDNKSFTLTVGPQKSGHYFNRQIVLCKEVSSVYVDGDLGLDIAGTIKSIGSFGVVSGQINDISGLHKPPLTENIYGRYL